MWEKFYCSNFTNGEIEFEKDKKLCSGLRQKDMVKSTYCVIEIIILSSSKAAMMNQKQHTFRIKEHKIQPHVLSEGEFLLTFISFAFVSVN